MRVRANYRKNPNQEPYLWNPVLDTLTEIETEFQINCSGHVGLSDGTILFAGGFAPPDGTTVETKIFSLGALVDPWQQVEDMTYSRFYPTCTTLPNGQVLAISGRDEDSQTVLTPEMFDPGDDPLEGTWQDVIIETSGIEREYPHMFVVPDLDPDVQKVFYSSSYSSYDSDPNTYMLDIGPPATWTVVTIDPLFHTKRGSAVMYEPGRVLKCGGDEAPFGGTLADTATINLNDATPAWQSELPMFFARREHNLVLLPDGKILAVGGADGMGGFVNVAEWFDPNDPFIPHWDQLAEMSIGRAHHSTAVLLADGRVLSAGGEESDGTAQIFSPPYLFGGARPVIGFAPTEISYGGSFAVILSGISPGAADIDKVSLLRLAAVTHSFDHNQRYVPLPIGSRLMLRPRRTTRHPAITCCFSSPMTAYRRWRSTLGWSRSPAHG